MDCKRDWIACLDRAKALGFDGVELFAGENGVNFSEMPEERCAEIARRARTLNLGLSVHPWVNWDQLDEDDMAARFQALIDRCIRMGVCAVNMHMHFLATRRDGMRRVFAATDPCLERLADAGVMLLYENVPEHGKRELGSEVIDFERLFDRYGADANVMLNIDSGHAHIMHQIAPLAEDYGDRWHYTHINDNDGLADLHIEPGAGTLDFAAFARAARGAEYAGILMMEYHERGLAKGMPVLEQNYGAVGYSMTTIFPDKG